MYAIRSYYAERAKRQGVTRDCAGFQLAALGVFDVLADARSEDRGTDEGGHAADHVDRRGTGEINVTEVEEPALRVPDPTSFDGVDREADDGTVDTICREFRALCHRAGNNRCRSGTEYEVEHETGKVKLCKSYNFV